MKPRPTSANFFRFAGACGLAGSALLPLLAVSVFGADALPPPALVSLAGEKVYDLGFDRLAGYPYTIIDAGTSASLEQIEQAKRRDQIPAALRAFDGKRVAVTGFMLPLQLDQGRVKKLILMRDVTTCCYGATPNMNDYVIVTLKGDGITAQQDIPVVFIGTLQISEQYESGYLVSLYRLDSDKFLGPKK